MRIGIPREIKAYEGRVGLIPAAAAELVQCGNEVYIESSAGLLSGYPDAAYSAVGVQILSTAEELYSKVQLIIKVKEPVDAELDYLKPDHILFSFLHLAANTALTDRLKAIGLIAVAFETVMDCQGRLPLLAPMSDIAGRLAAQIGCHLLHHSQGGKGILLGGVSGAERGRVIVLGAGTAGSGAARVAAALGAEVIVFDRDRTKLEQAREIGDNVTGLYSYADSLDREISSADLLIGAVLITGEKTPHLVSTDMVRRMGAGSVVIDVSVDQGGCIETIRPTNYADPTYLCEDVIHFGVTNMPGAVPRSASQPYALAISQEGWEDKSELASGINIKQGKIVHPALTN